MGPRLSASLLGKVGLLNIYETRLRRQTGGKYRPGPKKLVPGHRNGLVQLEQVINQENVLPTYVLRIDGLAVPLADVFLYRRLLMRLYIAFLYRYRYIIYA